MAAYCDNLWVAHRPAVKAEAEAEAAFDSGAALMDLLIDHIEDLEAGRMADSREDRDMWLDGLRHNNEEHCDMA